MNVGVRSGDSYSSDQRRIEESDANDDDYHRCYREK